MADIADDFDAIGQAREAKAHPVSAVIAERQAGAPRSKGLVMKHLTTPAQKRAQLLFAKYNFSPMETLIAVATDPECPDTVKHSIAAMLLPYEVPKLKSLDVNVTPQEGGVRVAIKQYTILNGQEVPNGPVIDVTSDEQRFGPHGVNQPVLDAASRAREQAVRQGLVEVVTEEDDDDDA